MQICFQLKLKYEGVLINVCNYVNIMQFVKQVNASMYNTVTMLLFLFCGTELCFCVLSQAVSMSHTWIDCNFLQENLSEDTKMANSQPQ